MLTNKLNNNVLLNLSLTLKPNNTLPYLHLHTKINNVIYYIIT